MPAYDSWSAGTIDKVCEILSCSDNGKLTHREITLEFKRHDIVDALGTSVNKKNRLAAALMDLQQSTKCANPVINFVQNMVKPIRFLNREQEYKLFLEELNQALSFEGFQINLEGKFLQGRVANTISDAESIANDLRRKLYDRGVHHDVLSCCRAELLQDKNYFHTILEASKSISKKLRQLTDLDGDGHHLVDSALMKGKALQPILAINRLITESELSQQNGLAHLIKGLFSMFRNLTAHDLKIETLVSEAEALEFLVLASLIHRKLDSAVRTTR